MRRKVIVALHLAKQGEIADAKALAKALRLADRWAPDLADEARALADTLDPPPPPPPEPETAPPLPLTDEDVTQVSDAFASLPTVPAPEIPEPPKSTSGRRRRP